MDAQGRRASDQCRPHRSEDRRPRRARAHDARFRARPLDSRAAMFCPIQRWNARAGQRWISERWPLRRGKLFLAPGDSPVGLRLPLNSLPWVAAVGLSLHSSIRTRSSRAGRCPIPRISSKSTVRRAASGQEVHRPVDRRRRRAHGAHRRTARRHSLRLHAAGLDARGLSRAARGGGNDRRAISACRCISRAIRRRSIRVSKSSR